MIKYIILHDLVINGFWIPNRAIIEIIDSENIIMSSEPNTNTKIRSIKNTAHYFNMKTKQFVEFLNENGTIEKTINKHYC